MRRRGVISLRRPFRRTAIGGGRGRVESILEALGRRRSCVDAIRHAADGDGVDDYRRVKALDAPEMCLRRFTRRRARQGRIAG